MALYHFHVGRVLRSRGQSSVEAAAYRAGEKLEDRYYGKTVDYTAKGGVLYSEIMAPNYVPESLLDRETLWNAVEEIEKHPKAQLAYSFDIALQNEFSMEENIAMAKRFVMENFVAKGMIADMAVHDPDKEGGIQNPHVHVMCPIRPVKEDGSWGEKQKREYLMDENGAPILDDKGKPKYNAVPTTEWHCPETLEHWRKAWADLVNAEFEKHGIDARIDHRSYMEQGVDLIPQVHEGPHVRNMEAKGIKTEKGNLNRWIAEINKGILALSKRIKDILFNIADLIKIIAEMETELKQPTVLEYVNAYFAKRNEATATYAYGRNKAKVANLKLYAKVTDYLHANKVTSVEDFREIVSGRQKELSDLNAVMKKKSAEMKELKDMIRYGEWYKQAQPILREICSTKNAKKKEQIKSQNDETMRKYYVAKRILFEEKKVGKIDIEGWQKRIDDLQSSYNEEYAKYKELAAETKLLRDIHKYIDEAVREKHSHRREEQAL